MQGAPAVVEGAPAVVEGAPAVVEGAPAVVEGAPAVAATEALDAALVAPMLDDVPGLMTFRLWQ